MPRTKSGTDNSASPSVAEIQAKLQKNFDEAVKGLIKLRDPNRNSSPTINMYDKETIRTYVQSPANYQDNLRMASLYYYYRSQIYYRICHWYSSMWDLRCRKVVPTYYLTKDNNVDKVRKQYENTLNALDKYNIQGNWHDVALRCYVEDVCYTVFYRDDTGAFFYILDPSECRIEGRYLTGDLAYCVDASKWRSAQRRELAEWLGSPFTDILEEYDRTGVRWIHMPDKYGAAFKFNSDRLDLITPPMMMIFQQLASLSDLADLQALKDEASVYKLLLLPMKVLSGSKNADDFEISPDLLLQYYDRLLDHLPEFVGAAPIPGEVTNDNVIDFSTTAADKDVDRLSQSQDTLLSTSGGGAVIGSNHITSSAAFAAWLKSESEFAISTLLPQIEGMTNRMLGYDVSGTPCKVTYFEVSVYTKKDLADDLLKMCQHSFSDRLALQTLLGFSEKDTLALEFLESNVLGLPELMNHPLQSTYTQSGTSGEVGQGRNPVSDDQLSDSGERSRNA